MINDYLKELEEQNVHEEKQIQVVQNPKVNELLEKMKELINTHQYRFLFYESCFPVLQKMKYTSEDVRTFSIELKRYEFVIKKEREMVGMFISALVNACEKDHFEIITEHLSEQLMYLGRFNKKNLVIKGNPGGATGHCMKNGSLTIHGSTGFHTGTSMESGSILVYGNVGDNCGANLRGGDIIVKGNAGNNVGTDMNWGRIVIEGNTTHFAGKGMKDGEILILGNSDVFTGYKMSGGKLTVKGDVEKIEGTKGGEIRVEGRINKLDTSNCKGKIYHQGELIYDGNK